MQERNPTVDILRLLAALEIILLHADFSALPDSVAVAIRLQARWAVPFFFIVSGYYLGRRLADPARADVQPSIYRLMWIFGLWSLIHIPLVLYQHDVREVFRRLLFPSFVYVGTYFHLWFPSSLILGYLALLFSFYYKLEKYLPLISGLIFLHIFLAGSYHVFGIKFLFEFETARHWVSVPLMYVGVLMARRGPVSTLLAAALVVGGLGLQAAEAYYLFLHYAVSPLNHEILFGTIPFAFGIASLGLRGLSWLNSPLLGRWGKQYALGIYLSHALVASLMGLLLSAIGVGALPLPAWQLVSPLLNFVACLGLLAAIRGSAPSLYKWLLGEHLRPG